VYTVELADCKVTETREVIRDYALTLDDHQFKIDLLPVALGGFDVVIGMDGLGENHAEIVCDKRLVRIPLLERGTLVIHGEKPRRSLNLIACMKAAKCLRKGCYAFLVHIVKKEMEERRIQGVPVVCDYPDVFPEELPILPPP
jgi:hypothetical protein